MEYSNFIRTGFLVLCLSAAGCSNTTSSSNTTTTTTTDSDTSSSLGIDVNRVVTTGQSLTFNNQTAGAFSMVLNPVSKLPAYVYHDKNHVGNGTGGTPSLGALKYAYLDTSGVWNIEVVDVAYGGAACGAANSWCIGAPNSAGSNNAGIISLRFNSEGVPGVAYVYGASLNTAGGAKEVRYATRSSSGVWTIETVFSASIGAGAGDVSNANTADPIKGVTLLFDGSKRPHVTFAMYTLSASILNSQIKYAFRDSTGTWLVSNITPAAQGSGAIGALGLGAQQAGAAFCSDSAGPIYAYQIVTGAAGLGVPAYIRCTSLAASGQCTSWSVQNLVTGCSGVCISTFTGATNAGNRIDLEIEPTTNKPVLAMFSTANPATGVQVIAAPNACNVAQPTGTNSWGALQVVESGATNGQNGLDLTIAGVNSYLLSYHAGTGSTRINRSTSGVSGFFATGTVIEAATNIVAGEGVGIAYDSDSDTVFVGYARLPAAAANATGNDIIMAYADPDIISSGGAAGSFALDVIDNTYSALPTPTANTMPFLSAARAANGLVGYTYFYQDATNADMKLYYGIRGGSTTAPIFSESPVTSYQETAGVATGVGLSPSLVYDANSKPVIAFHNGAEVNLQVARQNGQGNSFSVTVVDDSSADIGRYNSIARHGNYLGIAYRDETNTGLKFARWSPSGGWRKFAVDGLAGAGVCDATKASGQFAKLVFTSTGRPVIAFQDDTASNVTVRLAIAAEAVSSASFTWTCLNLDTFAANTRGEGLDLALDSNDVAHIVHYDYTAGSMRYLYSLSSVASAITSGTSGFSTGVDLATVGSIAALANANYKPSIQVNSSGHVFVSFQDIASDRFRLGTATSASGTFSFETIERAPAGTTSTTPIVGQMNSMILNSSGKPMIFYRSWENWIRYFSRE